MDALALWVQTSQSHVIHVAQKGQPPMVDLVLYITPTCPFCNKVKRYLSKHGIKLAERDITQDPAAREKLLEIGGKIQVPCLFIDGEPLYESDDIISYLDSHSPLQADKVRMIDGPGQDLPL